MADTVPTLSKLKTGQKVVIGDESFSVEGVIIEIKTSDEFPIKVNTNMGSPFELCLSDFGKSWSLKK